MTTITGAATVPLSQLARTIRSKNAGPFFFTFDVIFDDHETYEAVRSTGAINAEHVAELYGVPKSSITHFFEYGPGNAFKFTMRRPLGSGDVGEADVYGCQQYAPLLDLPVPWEQE